MSSIIDFGPHTVKIWVEETVTDSYGNPVKRPSETAVTVTGCTVTPLTSSRGAFVALDASAGQRVNQSWRFVARTAPLGWWSRVEWNGRRMQLLGGPLVHTASDGSQHVFASLREET